MAKCKHCDNQLAVLSECCLDCWLDVEHFIDPADWYSTGCYRVDNPDDPRLAITYAPFQSKKLVVKDGEEVEIEVGPLSFARYVIEWAVRLHGAVWVLPRQEFPKDKPVPPELRPDVAIPVGPQRRVVLAPQSEWLDVLTKWASDMGVTLEDIKVEKRKKPFGRGTRTDVSKMTDEAFEVWRTKKKDARRKQEKANRATDHNKKRRISKELKAKAKELSEDGNLDPQDLWWSVNCEKIVVTITCNHRHLTEEQLQQHADLWHGGVLGRRKRAHVHRLHIYDQDRNWGKVHHNHQKMLDKGHISNEDLIEHLLLDHDYTSQYPGDTGPWVDEHTHSVNETLMDNGVLLPRLGDLAGVQWRKGMMDSDAKVKGKPWKGIPDYNIKIRRKTAKYTMARGQMIAVPWDYDVNNPNKKLKGGHSHAWYFEPGTHRQQAYAKHIEWYHPDDEPDPDAFHFHERLIKDPDANMAKRLSTHHDYLDRLAEAKIGWWSKEGLLKMHTLLRMGHAAFASLSVTLGRAPELEWVVNTYLKHLEIIVQTVDSDAAIKSEVLRQTVIDGLVLQTYGFNRSQLLIAAPRRRWKCPDGTYTYEPIKGQPEEKVGIDDPLGRDWRDWVTYAIVPPNFDEVCEWLKMAGVKDKRSRERDAAGLVILAQVAGPDGRMRLKLDMIEQITGYDRKRVKRMIESWRKTGLVKSRPDDYKLGKPRKYTVLEQFRGELVESPIMDFLQDYYPEEKP